jgi:hypothetical protein
VHIEPVGGRGNGQGYGRFGGGGRGGGIPVTAVTNPPPPAMTNDQAAMQAEMDRLRAEMARR